jgi:hypothetical protein
VSGRDALDVDRRAGRKALAVHPHCEPVRIDQRIRHDRSLSSSSVRRGSEHCTSRHWGGFEGENEMSVTRLLPAWFHAIADYAVGVLLIVVAVASGVGGAAEATGIVVGATVLLVSVLTRYPLGIVKVLPFQVHSAGDYLAAALLIVAPFALGFNDTEAGISAFYVVMGIAVLAVSLITNYQYSDKREWNRSVPAAA